MARPDPSFVAQLIATAEQAPQTRSLRRASPADAQTAYGASARTERVSARTRHAADVNLDVQAHRTRTTAMRGGVSGDGCAPLPGCMARRRDFRRRRFGADGGVCAASARG